MPYFIIHILQLFWCSMLPDTPEVSHWLTPPPPPPPFMKSWIRPLSWPQINHLSNLWGQNHELSNTLGKTNAWCLGLMSLSSTEAQGSFGRTGVQWAKWAQAKNNEEKLAAWIHLERFLVSCAYACVIQPVLPFQNSMSSPSPQVRC